MRYAILTPPLRIGIINYKANYNALLNEHKIDYVPIAITLNRWVLPEAVLDDVRFSPLDLRGELDRQNGAPVEVRELLDNEKIP